MKSRGAIQFGSGRPAAEAERDRAPQVLLPAKRKLNGGGNRDLPPFSKVLPKVLTGREPDIGRLRRTHITALPRELASIGSHGRLNRGAALRRSPASQQSCSETCKMKQKLLFALAGAAFAAALGLSPAHALSPGAAAGLQADNLVQKVHFRHRSCELGVYGWHRHVGPYGVRLGCWPRARYPHRCFVDRFGYRHCWW